MSVTVRAPLSAAGDGIGGGQKVHQQERKCRRGDGAGVPTPGCGAAACGLAPQAVCLHARARLGFAIRLGICSGEARVRKGGEESVHENRGG
jgi:hypothetical protein